MRIYTKCEYIWNGTQYVLDKAEYFEYNGIVALACGPSSGEKSAAAASANFSNQLTSQATQVFGGASKVFQSLVNTFTPTVQAGPNQQGFSPAELSAMNSQAITQTGQAYKNAKAALGNQEAAVGGGNVTLPSGVNQANDAGLAESSANQTSSELNNITQENYAVGRQNYDTAVKGLAGSTATFDPATSAGNSATTALNDTFNQQSKMTDQSNSWVNAAIGALGGVASTAVGGLLENFTGSKGSIQGGDAGQLDDYSVSGGQQDINNQGIQQ